MVDGWGVVGGWWLAVYGAMEPVQIRTTTLHVYEPNTSEYPVSLHCWIDLVLVRKWSKCRKLKIHFWLSNGRFNICNFFCNSLSCWFYQVAKLPITMFLDANDAAAGMQGGSVW